VTTVLLIRHGRTAANTSGILAGRTSGVELDDVGVKQATEAGTRIGSLPLRAIVTSPLRRCRQTAQALQAARAGSCPTLIEQALVECGYGDWTGRSLRELSKEKLWQSVQQQPSAVRFPGGESMTEMSSRAVSAIRSWDRRLAAEHGEDAIWAAVSHGDVIKAILADALGMHLDSFQRLLVDPGSVSAVRYTTVRPYVITVNSTAGDLSGLFRAPPKKSRGRRTKDQHDAPVGGGLGTEDAVD
jgi:probable phosphomutase (TIGR03848 family)